MSDTSVFGKPVCRRLGAFHGQNHAINSIASNRISKLEITPVKKRLFEKARQLKA